MKKITIVGAGRVGEATAHAIAMKDMTNNIVLIDIREGAAKGAALDIQEAAPLFKFHTKVTGGADYSLMADSDLVIVTAGLPRKPGMSRSDVLANNIPVIDEVVEAAMEHAPDCILLFVTNPVDVVTYYAQKKTGWSRNRVIGQAGVLDSSRMACFIAMETKYSSHDIHTMVLGGHGDTMVPMLRFATISGIPVSKFLSQKKLDAIVERTRKGGAEILDLRQNSSAYNAPAAAVTDMVESIAYNRKRIMPTVSVLEGEYGLNDIAIGVPVVLGRNGIEKIVELDMTDPEKEDFKNSVDIVKRDIGVLKTL